MERLALSEQVMIILTWNTLTVNDRLSADSMQRRYSSKRLSRISAAPLQKII